VLSVVEGIALSGAFFAQLVRWLRVLQREHYEPASLRLFFARWSAPRAIGATSLRDFGREVPTSSSAVLVVALVITVARGFDDVGIAITIVYGLLCPWGLSVKGRTGPLHWTRRATTIGIVASAASVAIGISGVFESRPALLAIAMVWVVPVTLDIVTRVLAPFEERQAQKFVDTATKRLRRVDPRVVAITGSYGKTSTKNHLADLLSGDARVVASPRSYNNRAGLSRAINENLADGTQVFIAEMGTYGSGEIAALCSWCTPEISVVTAIGPVHLERMKSLDVIESAKFEITNLASTVVLNVDDERLARWVGRLRDEGKRVLTASRDSAADARVTPVGDTWRIEIDGEEVGEAPVVAGVEASNLACAIAAGVALGRTPKELVAGCSNVRAVDNRLNVATAPSGVVVIDDTFNANPASATRALSALAALSLSGRRVVVTPGMVELGSEQHRENSVLAQSVFAMDAELVTVARTNLKALSEGYRGKTRRFNNRNEAVAWVRTSLVAGDGVLYLNDLPDHYP